MPDESNFIVEILLKAIDQASGPVRNLNRAVDDLKAKAANDQATGDLSSGLDDVGRAARDAEGDVRSHRQETERASQSARTHADSVGRSADAVSSQGSALDKARASVQAHSQSTDDSTKAVKDHTQAVEKLIAEYQGWNTAARDVGLSNTESARGLTQISQEADKLTKILPRASQAWRDMANVANDARKSAAAAGTADDLTRLTKSYRDFDTLAKSGRVTASAAADSYKDYARSFDGLRDSIDKGSDSWRQIGKVIDEATKKAQNAKTVITGGGLLSGFLGNLKSGVSGGGVEDIDRAFQNLAAHVDNVGVKVVSLSAQLRGALLAAGIGLFQQLDTAIVGVVGSLFSVGSAAAQAGAALGGALVAGAAQAIPTFALLAGALSRLKDIMAAVQAASTLQQQTAVSGAQTQIQSLSATNSVISAQQQLANSSIAVHNAQENVIQSQVALTTARRDAQRQIQDLMLAEQQAELQEKGAGITLAQSQQNLQQVILSGGTGTVLESAQLGVQQAQLGVQQARTAVPRARADAARAQRQGVSGNPQVVAATQAVQQGQQSLTQAQQQVGAAARALQIAQLQAQNSTGAIQTATRTLDALLAKLSPTEQKVYEVMERLRKYFADPNSPFTKISDYIVAPFAGGLSRLLDLLNNRSFLAPLDGLGRALGSGVQKIFGSLLGGQGANFLDDMAGQATKNIPIIVNSFQQLIKIFEEIARAAAPALHTFIDDFNHLVTALAKKWSTPEGLDKLTDFFNKGAKYAEDFVHWAGELFNLLGALGGQGAPVGDSLIKGWTDSLNNLATWVRTHGTEVHSFFVQAGDALNSLGKILAAVGSAMLKLFDAGGLSNFGQLFSRVIVPVLTDAGTVLGKFTDLLVGLFNSVPGLRTFFDAFGGAAVAAVAIGKLYSPLRSVFGALNDLRKGNFSKLFGSGAGDIKLDSAGMETAAKTMDGAADKMAAAADKMSGAATEQGVASDKEVTAATEQGLAADKEVAAGAEGGLSGGTGGLGALGTLGLVGGGAAIFSQLATSLFHAGPQQFNQQQFINSGGRLSGFENSAFGSSLDPKLQRKSASNLLSQAGDLNVATTSDRQLNQLRSDAEKVANLPDITKTQRKGLNDLKDALDPVNVAMTRAGQLWSQTFAGINATTGSVLQQVKSTLKTDIQNISDNLGTGTTKGAQALAATIYSAWQTVLKNTNESVNGVHKGLSYLNDQLNHALKALGQAPLSLAQQSQLSPTVLGGLLSGTLSSGGVASPHASGGYEQPKSGGKIIQVAEAGYPEVVLTTDPKHADRQRGLLNKYLNEAPHILSGSHASGGWVRTGATIDPTQGQAPTYSAHGGMSFAELLEAGSNAGIRPDLTQLLGLPRANQYGMAMETPIDVRAVGSKTAYEIWKNDVGSGQSSPHYTVDLHSRIASLLGFGGKGDIEVAKAGTDPNARIINAATTAAGAIAASITAPAVKGAGVVGNIARAGIKKVTDATNRYLQVVTASIAAPANVATGGASGGSAGGNIKSSSGTFRPPFPPLKLPGPGGVVSWTNPDGSHPEGTGEIARWIANELTWAEQRGWSGNVTSGYRPGVDPSTASGASEHQGTSYPGGAIDFGGPVDPAAYHTKLALVQLAQRLGYPGPRLQMPVFKYNAGAIGGADDGHVSGDGHAIGGWIKAAKGFAGIVRRPTVFLTGEGNKPEHVQVTPMAAGGYVEPAPGTAPTAAPTESGIWPTPSVNWSNLSSISTVVKAISQAFSKLDDISVKSADFARNFTPFVNQLLTQDTGVFDRLAAGFTVVQNALNAALVIGGKAAGIGVPGAQRGYLRGIQPAYNVSRSGTVSEALDPSAQDAQSTQALEEQRRYLTGERGGLEAALGPVSQKLAQAKALAAKDPGKYTKALQALTGEYNNLIGRIQDITGTISQNVTDTFSAEQARVQDLLSKVSNKFDTKQGGLQTKQTIAQAKGQTGKLPSLDLQIANTATSQIASLQPALKEAERIKDPSLIAQIKQQIQGLQATAAQAAVQALSDAQAAIDQQAQTKQAGIQSKQSIAQAYGNISQLPSLDKQAADAAQQQINQLQPVLAKAKKAGDTGLVDQIEQEIDGLQSTIAQSTVQMIQDQVDIVNTAAQSQQAGIQSQQSIAQSLGQLNVLPTLDAAMVSSVQTQISGLQGALAQAQATGDTGAVLTITQQIQQLQATVAQATAQMIQDQIAIVQEQAQNAQAQVSELQSLSQTAQGAASTPGQFAAAGALNAQALQLNQSSLQSQLGSYNTLLGQASAVGDQSAVDSITQTIDQLTAELASNTLAEQDNTAQIVQQTSQFIQARGQFTSGVYGGLGSIIQTIGQITGTTDVSALRGVTTASNAALQGTNAGLLGSLSQLGGGASTIAAMLNGVTDPGQFASILGGSDFTGAENGQDQAWITTFESIISSLESNTTAIATNNQQLAQLNGQLTAPQTWASMTWTAFRTAVFSGMGNLLPQFQNTLTGSAIPNVAPIFSQVPTNNMSSTPTIGTLSLTHPVQQLDPDVLGEQLQHKLSTIA